MINDRQTKFTLSDSIYLLGFNTLQLISSNQRNNSQSYENFVGNPILSGDYQLIAPIFDKPEQSMAHGVDENELKKLFESHANALVLYARTQCEEPEDAVQEAFIELARLDDMPTEPKAWLYVVTRRRAINLTRAKSRRAKHHVLAAETKCSWFDSTESPRLDTDELQAALQHLPNLDREIVVARIWGCLTLEQVSELVDRPLSTIHRKYKQALEMMGKQLDRGVDSRG